MNYYIHDGEKIDLTPSPNFVALRYTPGQMTAARVASLTRTEGVGDKRRVIDLPNDGVMLLPVKPSSSQAHVQATLSTTSGVDTTPRVFEMPDGSLMLPEQKVNADLSGMGDPEIAALLEKVRARIAEPPTRDFPYHVLTPLDGDAIRLANALAEDEHLRAQPRFLKLLSPPRTFTNPRTRALGTATPVNDAFFSRQWGLAAIKADQAWSTTRGSRAVSVAIVDSGVDLDHPDLRGNLISGYDDVDGDDRPDPVPDANNAHGTACAGIVAAVADNVIGVAGVAPRCTILPIRLAFVAGGFLQERPGAGARAINAAVRLGAWVISNSYGGPAPDFTVQDAIASALSQGRDGRGCVVLASTGNDNGPVKYPARYPGVIAVAATRHDHDRCTPADWGGGQGSCFGPEVSIAAPGIDIWTTDISGDAGYATDANPGLAGVDYTTTFGGTSAACPFAAGVAALVLSANPALTAEEVRDILQQTADKTGSAPYDATGRNDFLGHGRVNALAAVQEAVRRR